MDASAHVKRGDRVTVLLVHRRKRFDFRSPFRVERMRVAVIGVENPFKGVSDGILAVHASTNKSTQKLLYPRDEGVKWIRGHHSEDSDEVKALLAAHALCAGQPSNR